MFKLEQLTKEQIKIKALLEEGMSPSNVSRAIWGNSSKESNVRRWVIQGLLEVETPDVQKEEDTPVTMISEEQELEVLCDNTDWRVANLAKRLRSSQKTNNQLRAIQREVFDNEGGDTKSVEEIISELAGRLEGSFYKCNPPFIAERKEQCTVEILFSDLQIGKVSEQYNTAVAKRALKYYGQEVLSIVEDARPERIVFASLGDIVEDHLKHGVQSAISTDTGLAEQMADAIESVWWSVLAPLVELGIPMEFVGIQGNHGSSEHKGMDMFKAGRYGYDYTIYKTWATMCKLVGADHVTFNIPEGHFTTYEIYGKLTVAEHGYGHNCTEVGMNKHKDKRATNLKRYVDRYVCGDMHHVCLYDNSNLCVNGAFFGIGYDAIEYSAILGFHAVPAQIVNIHRPITGAGQNTVSETKVIQVAKGYNFTE